ncbi:hypothetical protein BS47DRAFT_1353790, partial [Hydnum rufescens UP504]
MVVYLSLVPTLPGPSDAMTRLSATSSDIQATLYNFQVTLKLQVVTAGTSHI